MQSHTSFRLVSLAFAIVLGAQCVWLLLAEFSRPGVSQLPTDPQSAVIAAKQRNDAMWAAWIGAIRGDLWAESAYTYSDLLWASSSNESEHSQSLDQVRGSLERAIRYAPDQAGAWLLFAGLASHYQWSSPKPQEALRMSYYTGPNELSLIPLRLLVTVHLDDLGDSELQQLARRDLRLLIAHQEQSAIVQAYQSATPAGKQFIEQAVREIDPTIVESLRRGAQLPSLPGIN
jgi:hypothetical protein